MNEESLKYEGTGMDESCGTYFYPYTAGYANVSGSTRLSNKYTSKYTIKYTRF